MLLLPSITLTAQIGEEGDTCCPTGYSFDGEFCQTELLIAPGYTLSVEGNRFCVTPLDCQPPSSSCCPPGFTFNDALGYCCSDLTIPNGSQGFVSGNTFYTNASDDCCALLGVCVASIAPFLFVSFMDAPFTGFAVGFAALGLISVILMRHEWRDTKPQKGPGFRVILEDMQARRLLIIALVNAAPVAVSSTLFLFFVESRLGASDPDKKMFCCSCSF